MNDQLQALVSYVKNQMSLGVSEPEIRQELFKNGWQPEQVSEAFRQVVTEVPVPQPNLSYAGNRASTAAGYGPTGQQSLGMFSRRVNRRGFLLGWVYVLSTIVALFLAVVFMNATLPQEGALRSILNLLMLIAGLAIVVLILPVLVSLYVRRLHDLSQSGILALLLLIPGAGLFLFLYLLLKPGAPGNNQYGPPVASLSYLVVLGFKKPRQ